MVKLMVDEYVTRSGYHLQVHTEAECGGPGGSQSHPPAGGRTFGRRRFADREALTGTNLLELNGWDAKVKRSPRRKQPHPPGRV